MSDSEQPGIGEVKRPRIVIAEDFVLIQETIRLLLETDCDVVATAEDGEAALEAVLAHNPDVLVIDISLPVLTGFDVAERLKSIGSAVRVIFLTAHRDSVYAQQAFEAGGKGYVIKAAMVSELRAAVKAVMSGGTYRSLLLP